MQWEYKLLTGYNQLTEDVLDALGAEGWELVGLTSHTETIPVPGATVPGDTVVICVFKRPKPGATI
jgi:hypothetical protein